MSAPLRASLGFIAAALSVLTFHQAMWAVLHAAGMMPPAPYPMNPTPPFGVPQIASLCFWGGLYGAVFGLALPMLNGPRWLWGLALGIAAALVGFVVVGPIKGRPVDLSAAPLIRSFLINGCWGIGVGLIAPLLIPQRRRRSLAV